MLQLTILGEPKAQKRHRHAKRGKFIGTYDPSKMDKLDLLHTIQHHAPAKPYDVPLKFTLKLYFGRPKSHYGTGKNASKLKDNAPLWHTSKPDVDNLFKFITDAMSGIFYKDDSYIVEAIIIKQYDEKPRIEITLEEK